MYQCTIIFRSQFTVIKVKIYNICVIVRKNTVHVGFNNEITSTWCFQAELFYFLCVLKDIFSCRYLGLLYNVFLQKCVWPQYFSKSLY